MKVKDLLNSAALEYSNFELPSKGKVYSNNVSSVKIRPTKTVEEKYLKTIARGSTDFNEKISRYLGLITDLYDIGLDPVDLTISDQLALLIYSRIISKDTVNHPTDVVCPNCSKQSRKVINLMELSMIYLPEDYSEPQEVSLPLHGITLGLKLLRVKDYMEVSEFHRSMRTVNVDLGDPDSDYEGLYARAITSVSKDGEEVKIGYSDKRELLLNMDSRSMNVIPDFLDKYFHGYDLRVDFECPSCLERNKIGFNMGADFFFRVTSASV